MAGYEVGSAYLSILPSVTGFAASLGTAVTPAMSAAGITGGNAMGAGMATGGRPSFMAAGGLLSKVFIGAFAAIGASSLVSSAIGWFQETVDAASDLFETQNKVNEVFGDGTAMVIDYARTAASELGQSQQTFLDGASTFGIFGQSAGLAGDELSSFSIDMVGLATDLASFNNTSPEDAIQAIGAALRGESEPIRRYGVLLDDATLKAQAFTLGIYEGTGALTPQQRVLAAHAEILKQTSTQQGDFGRTSGGLANQQRILTAEMENVKVEIGNALLPVMTELFGVFADVGVPILQDLAEWFSSNGDAVRTMVLGIVSGLLAMADGFFAFGAFQSEMTSQWLTLWTNMTQAFLNFTEFMVDAAVQAFGWIPGLGPQLIDAKANFENFRAGVDEKFTSIRTAAQRATEGFNGTRDMIHSLQDTIRSLDGSKATVTLAVNDQNGLLNYYGGRFEFSGGVGRRAGGGDVFANTPYVVGEAGAELFVPDRSGTIYNQAQVAAMGGGGGRGAAPIYVQNPFTGEYLLARVGAVADGRMADAGARAQYAGRA